MDRELEEQIDDLINKSIKDLKTRILRIMVRNQNKLLKDQARELKNGTSTGGTSVASSRKPVEHSNTRKSKQKVTTSRKSSTKRDSDSDSDGYYSD
jgi:hypothetical protein